MRLCRVPLELLCLQGLLLLCSSCGSTSPEQKPNPQAKSTPPTVQVAAAASKKLAIDLRLPGELQAYEAVAIYPKVTGFVESIPVDRGSAVRRGQVLVRLVAPEIAAQRAEAQSKLQGAEAARAEAEAKFAANEGTYRRLKNAASTPGAVAANDLEVAQKATDADRARVDGARESASAAKEALKAVTEIEGYLQVRAPFEGMVTERNVHPGALVGPSTNSASAVPMLRVEKTNRLRLLVPVPEKYAAGVATGTKVEFTVPAFPDHKFSGKVARVAHSLDIKTRTMPVELDVSNADGRLASGMFPEVRWPVRRTEPTLFVLASSVARTTEATFVIRVRDNKTEWVNVQTGATEEKLIEVFGDVKDGDWIAVRGTDELRPGTTVSPQLLSSK